MKVLVALTAFLMLYFSYGIYISQVNLSIAPAGTRTPEESEYYEYRGAVNVRSNLSNGSSSPQEIIASANASDLDFLILSDLNSNRDSSLNGYHGNLLVMNESEHGFLDSRLLFVEGASSKLPTNSEDTHVFLTDLLSQRGTQSRDSLLFLAHPYNPGLTWIGPLPEGLNGIEIINPRSIAQKAWIRSKINVSLSLLLYPFNSKYSFLRLFREPKDETSLWDQLNQNQRVFGLAGSDASARAVPFTGYLMKFPSYESIFELASNHLILKSELTGNAAKDRAKIIQAFRAGNYYSAIDIIGNPKGFNCVLKDREQTYLMGSKVKFSRGLKLTVQLPYTPTSFFEIVLFKNGERISTSNKPELNEEIKGPGVYRTVVRVSPNLPFPEGKKWISWIYSNPFFVEP